MPWIGRFWIHLGSLSEQVTVAGSIRKVAIPLAGKSCEDGLSTPSTVDRVESVTVA